MSIRYFLSIILISLLTVSQSQAQLYKIVDEDGNVSFSQYPPIEKDENANIESIELDSSSSGKTSISTKNNTQYCGDIPLPQKRVGRDEEYFLRNVASKQSNWERRLDSLEKSVEQNQTRQFDQNKRSYRYQSDSYRNQRDARNEEYKRNNIADMRDLRCAIAWSKEQREQEADIAVSNTEELIRLQNVYNTLMAQQLELCGEEPYLDTSSIAQTRKRNEWKECVKPFNKKVRPVNREIQKVSQRLRSPG